MYANLNQQYSETRAQSIQLCEGLAIEDYGLQAEAFTSPPKWHLAHTSWFFETFILKVFDQNYQTPHHKYEVLFNSYYNGIGVQFSRAQRGVLSRPTVSEVMQYRQHVDHHMSLLLTQVSHPSYRDIAQRCKLGIEHERQHQELLFTDLKYCLGVNPLAPAYSSAPLIRSTRTAVGLKWIEYGGGLFDIGHQGNDFAFDNEQPRHKTYLTPFMLANRLVTNGEFQQFIDEGGYRQPEYWLADGWATVQEKNWQHPHFWFVEEEQKKEFTLHGAVDWDANMPVCHISGYEADAYARWAGARLPTEAEWEHGASGYEVEGAGLDDGIFHPQSVSSGEGLLQLYGSCWQWTQSAYSPYPGFKADDGAIGEYNGKFMSNQWVLRGGSCVSKRQHLRASYRNFFYPQERWQFSGLRLAKSLA